jgi:hypothetical protein
VNSGALIRASAAAIGNNRIGFYRFAGTLRILAASANQRLQIR